MANNEFLNEIRAKLGDSPEENDKILRAAVEQLAKEGDLETMNEVGQMMMDNLPEEKRNEIMRLTHVDGVRLDQLYEQVEEHLRKNELIEAKSKAEKLYKKITVDFAETDKVRFVSLRNPFEDNLCQLLFPADKTLNRCPFDFCTFITTYAYILVETGSSIDALPVLEKARQFNPVDVGPLFEMAEIFKMTKNKKRIVEITRDTLKIASSPLAIARCYANMGYILTDFAQYEEAAVFYTASAMMAPNPAIPLEMQHLADLKGSQIAVPSREQIEEVMKKYDMTFGADNNVISVAAQLSVNYLTANDIPNALMAMKMTYNLTRDESIKKLILKYEPDASMDAPAPGEKPNITQTVNNNPEE